MNGIVRGPTASKQNSLWFLPNDASAAKLRWCFIRTNQRDNLSPWDFQQMGNHLKMRIMIQADLISCYLAIHFCLKPLCVVVPSHKPTQAACVWGRGATLTALWAAQLILVPSSYINRDPKAILPKWKGGGGGKREKPSQVSGAEQHSARRYTTSVLTSDSRSKQIIRHPQRRDGDTQAAEQRSLSVHGRVSTQCVRRNVCGNIAEITFVAVSGYCWALFPPQSVSGKAKKDGKRTADKHTSTNTCSSCF